MQRRSFLTLLGSAAAAWPLGAGAQQPAMPIVGQLTAGGADLSSDAAQPAAFRKGFSEMGYVAGRNFVFDYRGTDRADQLPALAAGLVRRQVALIVTTGNAAAALAAKAATTTIPIVFVTSTDPVRIGLVETLNRPGGNATGVTNFGGELVLKRLELMRELVPQASLIGFLTNPNNAISEDDTADVEAAARSIGQQIVILRARNEQEIDAAFAEAARRRLGALVVDPDAYFNSRRNQITALAARYAIPANYNTNVFAEVGGLMSYGDDRFESYHQTGVYAGRVLKGENPADLPVFRPTKFEFVLNLKTAKALGIEFPPSFHLRATQVIE